MSEQINARLNDLERQIQAGDLKLEEAKAKLAMDPSPENAEEVTRLKRAAENLAAAYQAAKVLESKARNANQSDQAKQSQKKLADLEARAGGKKTEILKTVNALMSEFNDLETLANEHRKLAWTLGKVGFERKGVYKFLFALKKDLTTWQHTFRQYQRNREDGNQVKTAKLTPLQKAVHAERYHDPDVNQRRVRLVQDDPSAESDPDNIRIG